MIYDENNEDYSAEYGSEVYYEPVAPKSDTSSLDISDYEVSDVETLTSQDWEELKKEQNVTLNSTFTMDTKTAADKKNDPFARLKGESRGGNDDWVFLVWGIALISVGALAVAAVIISTVHSKKKYK